VLVGFLLRGSGRMAVVHCRAALPAPACLVSATTAASALSLPCNTLQYLLG